jgi:4-amino-4-deoxy-L-arabinose transferase-like glycosyltransferase
MKTIHPQFILWFIAILAIALRIGSAVYLGDELTGPQQTRVQDQVSYNALARSILAGQGYTFEQDWYPGFTPARTPTAHWSFLYPLYLAGVYALTGYHPVAARLLQGMVAGGLMVWLLYRLGRHLAGEMVGLISAGLGAVYAYFIFHDASLMTEAFFIVGVLAMLNLALAIVDHDHPAVWQWLLFGLVLGVTTLLRQTILLWLPFLLAWLVWARRGRMHWWGLVGMLGVIVLVILPWTVRNYRVYGAFLPLNSNAGYALYSANHPNQGAQFDQDYTAPLPGDLVDEGMNEAQWNTALTLRGLEFIRQDPGRYLLLSLDRVGYFFNFWFSAESSLASNLMRVLSFGLYLPFFIYGLLLSFKDWRRYSLIYLFGVVYSVMHILTWAGVRYRLPVDAALMPLAALAVVDLAARLGVKGFT